MRNWSMSSYLRMKIAQLSYSLPEKFCRSKYIKAASVYTSAENLITITLIRVLIRNYRTRLVCHYRKTFTLGLQVTL